MLRWAALPFGLLAVSYSVSLVAPTYAQSPLMPKGCLRPSGFIELKNPSDPKVIVQRVDFDGPIHLPDSVVMDAVAYENSLEPDTNVPFWLDQFAELGLKAAWQDRGYYRAKVTAEAHSLGSDSKEERFLVTAHVDEGLQYHLGDLKFVNTKPSDATPFSDSQLRDSFSLQEGQLLNVALVRKGMEELNQRYISQGYIDFTATPEIQTDDYLQRISIVMRLDPQKQFRVRTLEVIGLDPILEGRLRATIRPGSVYDPTAVDAFLKQNHQIRPPDKSLNVSRNQSAGTVDLIFDFRPCPPM